MGEYPDTGTGVDQGGSTALILHKNYYGINLSCFPVLLHPRVL